MSFFTQSEVDITGARRLLLAHNIVIAARVFFEIFLNLYIWKLTQDLTLVAWFNIVYLLTHTAAFHLFAYFVKEGWVHLTRVLSLVGFAAIYLGIYLLGEAAVDHVLAIAFAIGLVNGMYWIGYHVLRFDLTNGVNRGNYTGLEKGTKTFVDIVMPALGGAIIAANFFGQGYASLFLAGVLLFLSAIVLGNVPFPETKTPKLHIGKTFAIIFNNGDALKSNISYMFDQFSRGGTVLRLILPLLLFDVLQSELELGGLISFFAIVSIFGSFVFGRYCKYHYYKLTLTISTLVYAAALLTLIFFPSFWAYIVFGILARFAGIAIDIPKRVISENIIDTLPDKGHHRVEYIVIREWFNIGLGRVLSMVPLLFVTELSVESMSLLFIAMAVAAVISLWLLRSIRVLD